MPTVPTRDTFNVTQQGGQSQRVASSVISAEGTSAAGRQMDQLGRAVQGAASDFTAIEIDAQNQVNQVRVADAVNRARQVALDLTYDPEKGFMNLRGDAALQRPDGVSLPDEYTGKFTESLSSISASLGNEAQQRAFQQNAAEIGNSLRSSTQSHMLKEFNTYQGSVLDGAVKLSVQEAEMNWNNPEIVAKAINGVEDPETGVMIGGIKQSIYAKAKLGGLSANEATAAMRDAESGVHAQVIQSALLNGNPAYASEYFSQNKKNMTADGILKVQGQITTQMDGYVSAKVVKDTTRQYQANFMPQDMDRLTGIVMQMESSGNRYGPDGEVIQGPVTRSGDRAQGEMQVMSYTAKDPGYGVTPAKDDSPDELARVGRDYLKAMVVKYGDINLALAAYNAGPGNVDKAVKKAEEDKNPDWISYLPKPEETRPYVERGSKEYQAGMGAPVLPTKLEFTNQAVAALGEAPRPELAAKVRESAEKQYTDLVAARKQKSDEALAAAQQELLANGGNYSALPVDITANLASIDPENSKKAMDFAKAIADGGVTTNMEAYAEVVTNPDILRQMSDTAATQFVTTNFAPTEQKQILQLRADVLSGKADNGANSINNSALNDALESRLLSIGINPTPPNSDTSGRARVGTIQKTIRDDIYEQQAQLGRKMSSEEIEERVDYWATRGFTQIRPIRGNKDVSLLTQQADDIDATMRRSISDGLKARGVVKPTDDDILQVYYRLKQNG